jgi:hypothetical protein
LRDFNSSEPERKHVSMNTSDSLKFIVALTDLDPEKEVVPLNIEDS